MKKLLTLLGILFLPALSFATHIVGGELNYKYLGSNLYEIKLRLYRDCGSATAPYDNPATVGIFDSNNALITSLSLPFPGSTKLSPTFVDTCIIVPTNICVEVAEYAGTITLPPRAGGYQLAYQRCCRNGSINNIIDPVNTGSTFYASIPDQSSTVNSNPLFNKWPSLFVCVNKPIIFDHSAVDQDGDSVYYDICTPFSGANTSLPNPVPPGPPPYSYITWKAPYDTANVLGGIPLTIDPNTGLLTGTPNTLGQFVVGVRAAEYRNGILLGVTRRDFQFNVVDCPSQQYCKVWPGDTDNNYQVDNTDLLPLGLHFSQTGTARSAISNSWQGYPSPQSWSVIQNNGYDAKHVDCNGDGVISYDDTLAINLNFSLTHTIVKPLEKNERASNPDLFFATSSNTYLPGDWIEADVMIGTSGLQVNDLYGIAFDINYNSSLVEPGTASIIYPSSWFANPVTNAVKLSKNDALANTIYGAETRIDKAGQNGHGKIATFRFKAKTSLTSSATMNLSFSGYRANNSAGNYILLNPQNHSILIDPFATTVKHINDNKNIRVYPNPYIDNTTISYTLNSKAFVNIEVYNPMGQRVETLVNAEQTTGEYMYPFSAKERGHTAGVYFVKLTVDGNTTVKRLVEIK